MFFQFGRSGTWLSVSFVRRLYPLGAVFVLVSYIKVMGHDAWKVFNFCKRLQGTQTGVLRAWKPRAHVPASPINSSGITAQSLTLLGPQFPQL